MSQKQRIDSAGALYYLQMKGSGHRELFSQPGECLQLRQLLDRLCDESGGRIIGYCLLHDGIHLVVRTPTDGRMSAGDMGRWLMAQYSSYYNGLHGRSGSVFHDHFPTVLIEANAYLLPVIHKLHRLPVSVGLVPRPAAYPWSSHRDYLALDAPQWLDRDDVLRLLTQHHALQVRRYELLVEEHPVDDVPWVAGCHPHYRALASDDFIQRLINHNRRQYNPSQVELAALVDWVCAQYSLSRQDLRLWRRHRLMHEVRAVVATLASRLGCASLSEVAAYFVCDEELLETGMRALESHRGMYLYGLELRIERDIRQELADDLAPEVAENAGVSMNEESDELAADWDDGRVSQDYSPASAHHSGSNHSSSAHYGGYGQNTHPEYQRP